MCKYQTGSEDIEFLNSFGEQGDMSDSGGK
jgi:hypothetical protein